MQDSVKQLSYAELTQCTILYLQYRRQIFVLCLSQAAASLPQAAASMAFRSSFASVPLQVTFAGGRKALTALTEHYVPCAGSQCGAAVTVASRYLTVRPSPGLNVAKQPDFSIRHRTLLQYRFVHVRRHYDSTCNALQPCPFHDTNRHRATASVRGHCAFRVP